MGASAHGLIRFRAAPRAAPVRVASSRAFAISVPNLVPGAREGT